MSIYTGLKRGASGTPLSGLKRSTEPALRPSRVSMRVRNANFTDGKRS